MSERIFNIGNVGMAVEVTPGTALAPTDWVETYDFGMTVNRNIQSLEPAAGNMYSTQQVVPGLRDHTGDGTFIFEPNTAEKFTAMMLNQTSRTGGGPYTGVYGLSSNNPPGKTYSIQVSDGNSDIRHYGCQVSKLATNVNGNEIQIKPTFSALGTFDGREILSVAGTSPYVITLKTDSTAYDPAPATGVVVGDKMQVYQVSGGTTIAFTVSAVTGTTISTTTNVAAAASGDFVRLTPLTQSLNLLPPVLWSNTQFCFGATAAAALSAAQTRVEPGSGWEVDFDFQNDKGEHRSGAQDPATLLRKPAKVTLKIKKYFDTPTDLEAYNNLSKSACVVRHYVYSGATTYEYRVTFNNLTTNNPVPKWKAGEINYSEIDYIAKYDTGDGQAFAITTVNSNSTLT